MKTQFAVFVDEQQFICESLPEMGGVEIFYADVKPRISIGTFDMNIPEKEEGYEADTKFVDAVTDHIKANYVLPIKSETLTMVATLPTGERETLTPFSQKNLNVIENFLLYFFAPDESKENVIYNKMMESAYDYISEDHTDGEDSEQAREEAYRIKTTLEALDVVENDPELRQEFGAEWNFHFEQHRIFIKADHFKPQAAKMLRQLAARKNKA